MPSITALPLLSRTVAVMVVVPKTVIEDGFTATLTLAGGGANMLIITVPFNVPEVVVAVADTVTEVGVVPDVKTTCATPLALVTAVELPSVAAALLRVKATVTPEIGLFVPSFMVTVMVDGLLVDIDVELADSDIVPIPVD